MMAIRLFSSDIDGTLAGNRDASRRFADFWNTLDPSTRPLLVYNSGRLVDDILEFTAGEGLPEADIVIGGVGTMLHAGEDPDLSNIYSATLRENYDSERVAAVLQRLPGFERQPDRYQHALKSSWYFHDATEESLGELEARLRAEGLSVKVVYSSDRDLDILPATADKGMALRWICGRLDIALDEVVVAGDTGNDAAMFELPNVRGIIPRNGRDELRRIVGNEPRFYHATKDEADGIVEGLSRWLDQ
ncbi:HAD-IIB family hydrolase [Ciceribacter sp. L1K23]|nr:HAD-IIB family hydrolase [Ciceribacter sp. L1K23]MBR0556861.1 HAD-IIB family hydrolase [Ciceribacter sp. L1K23]